MFPQNTRRVIDDQAAGYYVGVNNSYDSQTQIGKPLTC